MTALKMPSTIQKHGHSFKDTDRCCFNCKHLIWMIGIGQGLKCGVDFVKNHPIIKSPPSVPSIAHLCERFSGYRRGGVDTGSTEWSCKCPKCERKRNEKMVKS